MNIFFLSMNPMLAAMMMCDKHIIKMILESAQILSMAYSAILKNQEDAEKKLVYKTTKRYLNHPATIWAQKSSENFQWLLAHACALLNEHKIRYNPKQVHKSRAIIYFIIDEFEKIADLFPQQSFTKPPLMMPEECRISSNTVKSYRYFYRHDKSDFAKWQKIRKQPSWWDKVKVNEELEQKLIEKRTISKSKRRKKSIK